MEKAGSLQAIEILLVSDELFRSVAAVTTRSDKKLMSELPVILKANSVLIMHCSLASEL